MTAGTVEASGERFQDTDGGPPEGRRTRIKKFFQEKF